MSSWQAKTLCILGRQPALGLAELESLYGPEAVQPLGEHALLNVEAGEVNFKRLGGAVKVAQILAVIPSSDWSKVKKYLLDEVPGHLDRATPGKFRLGLSFYGFKTDAAEINRLALTIKKTSKRSVRVIPNKAPELNSAQVLHNKLTTKGAWELLLVADGQRTLLAQTFFVQDIEDYGARDQVRPKRDSRVGMLPPKLAQIIINLAVGQIERIANRELSIENESEKNANSRFPIPNSKIRILDPFCGTGVVLQEALLMGYSAMGSDLEPRLVDYSKENIRWLIAKQPRIEGNVVLEQADATEASWAPFSTVASEVYLGRPLAKLPESAKLGEIVQDVNTITRKFLKNLASQLKPGRTICLAVPAWRLPGGRFKHLPVLDQLTDMGYTRLSFGHVEDGELIYFRENQIVARELLILAKA